LLELAGGVVLLEGEMGEAIDAFPARQEEVGVPLDVMEEVAQLGDGREAPPEPFGKLRARDDDVAILPWSPEARICCIFMPTMARSCSPSGKLWPNAPASPSSRRWSGMLFM
jgi:hypothetical protein